MKPKDYVRKYNLDQGSHFDQNSFVKDLTLDFQSTIEFLQSKDQLNYERFKSVIKEIRQKYDSINNKSGGKLTEGLWNYFYATIIVKVRDQLFGEYLRQKQNAFNRKKAERNQWHNS